MTLLFLTQASLIWVFKSSLKAGHPQRVDDTYHLLMDVHNWDALSNNTVGGGVPTNSLESIHNSIHIDIGGHMSDGAVAGRLFRATEFLGNV